MNRIFFTCPISVVSVICKNIQVCIKEGTTKVMTSQSTHFLQHIHNMYAFVPLQFTHTYTLCKIRSSDGRFVQLSGVSLFLPSILYWMNIFIMNTLRKFHVEKSKIMSACVKSFTERLEEGNKVTQVYPASEWQGREQIHSPLDGKTRNEELEPTVTKTAL